MLAPRRWTTAFSNVFFILVVNAFVFSTAEDSTQAPTASPAPTINIASFEQELQDAPLQLHLEVFGYPSNNFPVYTLVQPWTEAGTGVWEVKNSNGDTTNLNVTGILQTASDLSAGVVGSDENDVTDDALESVGFVATAVTGTLGGLDDKEFTGIVATTTQEGQTVTYLFTDSPASILDAPTTVDDRRQLISEPFDDTQKTRVSLRGGAANAHRTLQQGECNANEPDCTKPGCVSDAAAKRDAKIKKAENTFKDDKRIADEERKDDMLKALIQKTIVQTAGIAGCFLAGPLSAACIALAIAAAYASFAAEVAFAERAYNRKIRNITRKRDAAVNSACNEYKAAVQKCKCKEGDEKNDPHMTTFDGLKYDCQARGEFTLIKSLDSLFEVQTRVEEWVSPDTSTASAVVVRSDDASTPLIQVALAHRGIISDDSSSDEGSIMANSCPVFFHVDGIKSILPSNGKLNKPKFNVELTEPGQFKIEFPNESEVFIDVMHPSPTATRCWLNVRVFLRNSFIEKNRLVGLIGSPDGDYRNDWMDRMGAVLNTMPPLTGEGGKQIDDVEASYDYCTKNWCIEDEANTLFTYEDGLSFSDYHLCDLPYEMLKSSSVATDDGKASDALRIACGEDEDCLTDGIVGSGIVKDP